MSFLRITDVTPAGAYIDALNAANESAACARRHPDGAAKDLPELPSPAARARAWIAALRSVLRTAHRVERAETV